MSSQKLSAVLEKLIHRLGLDDFPCGNGSWRATNPKRVETEETDALLDLLSCPHSPWRDDASWSPQASALRQLTVLTPKRLPADFIYNYFTTLRIVDKDVSIIDDGLLKFSKLEELLLSANKISVIPAENLPCTLRILELCANRLSALNSLTCGPPPHLQYLGLSSNSLGSHEDVSHLTGRHWPQLVCLDLSDCEFEDQRALLDALSTLPCLRTLLLEGNPFTLACCYPGLTVDSLPQLSCLDASWISPEERGRFRGLSRMRDLMVKQASATVSVGRMRGVPDPMISVDENVPDFPLVTYSYFISYEFLIHQTTAVLRHSTSKLVWSEGVDFSDTQTHAVSDLGRFKRFLNRGLYLRIEEEKVLSWPAPSEDKGGKGKETPIKSGSTKDKSKDKKKKSVPELVHDAPITRVLGSVHVPLHSLLKRGQKVDILCDLGVLHTESEDVGKKTKEDKKKEEKETKQRGGSGRQKNTAASKGKGRKDSVMDVPTDNSVSVPLEPVTVELRVELEKWQSASEVCKPLLSHV
uniref:leucine-rich repeat-containing protein 43-like n=1 Tax=Semicossyphus pulcher TaxID=241346 RepID=UPI0037E7506E